MPKSYAPTDFGDNPPPEPPSAPISLINALLTGITIPVVACACGLGAYLGNTAIITHLQQAGYTIWPGSGGFDLPIPIGTPSSSIWYIFQPGAKLSFAFTTDPTQRGSIAALAILIGGFTGLIEARRWAKITQKNRPGIAGIAAVFCLLGFAALIPPWPTGFAINFGQQTMANSLSPTAATIPLNTVRAIQTYTHHSRHGSGSTDVYAVYSGSHDLNLVSLESGWQAQTLQSTILSFLNSQGQTF